MEKANGDGGGAVHWGNVIYILKLPYLPNPQPLSKIHAGEKRCSFAGGTKFGPFIARKVVLFRLRPG